MFPLPNCVLFPGVVQPLHIFEPRYREMMEAVLGDQKALVVALLRPGWEKTYYENPPIFPVACVGRVLAHERLEDGKYNLLLLGVARARVLFEQRAGAFRVAMLEPMRDAGTGGPDGSIGDPPAPCGHELLQRRVLRELFEKTALKDLTVSSTLATLFEEKGEVVPLSRVVDALSFTLVQDVGKKQELLEEVDPLRRGEKLLQELVALAGRLENHGQSHPTWPPEIGVN
jgi:Lon protease-like protein